ncbi:hypothetical protein GCM10010435_71770 [Winogradskya consettensis]|uniref:Uncharacterized protein n=1 Tax=Winogradskya consettensis TaxID=113560 RepID=A0A919W2Q2_9ACTN|nr:hypothetical protein Aco04nite_56460 [Actinoplanes consettensis]
MAANQLPSWEVRALRPYMKPGLMMVCRRPEAASSCSSWQRVRGVAARWPSLPIQALTVRAQYLAIARRVVLDLIDPAHHEALGDALRSIAEGL